MQFQVRRGKIQNGLVQNGHAMLIGRSASVCHSSAALGSFQIPLQVRVDVVEERLVGSGSVLLVGRPEPPYSGPVGRKHIATKGGTWPALPGAWKRGWGCVGREWRLNPLPPPSTRYPRERTCGRLATGLQILHLQVEMFRLHFAAKMFQTRSSSRQRGELEASPVAVDAWVSALLLQFPGQRIAVALLPGSPALRRTKVSCGSAAEGFPLCTGGMRIF
jgi:hypothetical protein